MKDGKKNAEFIVLKKGFTFLPNFLLSQKASSLFKSSRNPIRCTWSDWGHSRVFIPADGWYKIRRPNWLVRRERLPGGGRGL